MFTKLYCKALCAKTAFARRLRSEKGAVDLVVMVIMIAIVVGLAFIFRKQIADLVNSVFGRATEATEQLSEGTI